MHKRTTQRRKIYKIYEKKKRQIIKNKNKVKKKKSIKMKKKKNNNHKKIRKAYQKYNKTLSKGNR